jgi:hypothetical protein
MIDASEAEVGERLSSQNREQLAVGLGRRGASVVHLVEQVLELVGAHGVYRACFVDFSGIATTMMICAGRNQPDRA